MAASFRLVNYCNLPRFDTPKNDDFDLGWMRMGIEWDAQHV